ncbi:MAG: DUF5777 family beta-barrel protein [Thermoanaerobaculia bacterium]
MKRNVSALAALGWIALAAGSVVTGQEPAPEPTPAPAETPEPAKQEPARFRPIESNVIVNLPSVEVPPEGTLTFLVTHRFTERIQNGNIQNFFTLDKGNTWGFGLWYAPIRNLNVGFYRSSDLDVYEASAQYELPRMGGFGASLRVGEDWRTDVETVSPHSSFFVQAILAYSFGPYVRLTAVPSYLQRTTSFIQVFPQPGFPTPPPGDRSCKPLPSDNTTFLCHGLYENFFNVPVGVSIALTHSITVHGEVIPRRGIADSSGVGWSVTVEKSLLRHRFAFFAGNQRKTTLDQYLQSIPFTDRPGNVYIGFNLFRQWKLK